MVTNDVEKRRRQIQANIMKSIQGDIAGNGDDDFVKADASDLKKASDVEEELQKSDVMNALDYQENIKISKTGKEIKNQIKTLLEDKKEKLEERKLELTDALDDTGEAPTHEADNWWKDNIRLVVPYPVYSWEECRFYAPNVNSVFDSERTNNVNSAESKEQAAARERYNDIVRGICGLLADIKACEVLNNLEDRTKYDLTPRQAIALNF
jgi:hypothetical protein